MTTKSRTTTPLTRFIRIRLPDSSYTTVKLPKATGVGLGAYANFFVIHNERLYVFWVERIKGGWRLIRQSRKNGRRS